MREMFEHSNVAISFLFEALCVGHCQNVYSITTQYLDVVVIFHFGAKYFQLN